MDFRRLTDEDLPLLHRWLNDPGVVEWWEGEDVSWPTVVREYGSANDQPVEFWIAVVDGREVGWIQCYAIADHLGGEDEEEILEWVALGIPETAAGIDYLIGDPSSRGRGLGSLMISAFVEQVVFGQHPVDGSSGWDPVCASPYQANTPSWKALAAAGFHHHGTFDDDDGPCRLMVRWRDGRDRT